MKIATTYHGAYGAESWSAIDDDTYDAEYFTDRAAPVSNSPMGWGATEQEAVEDLREKIDEAQGQWDERTIRSWRP